VAGKRCAPGCTCGHHTRKFPSADERWARFVTEGAPDECWEWKGALSSQGYGTFNLPGHGQILAPRAALIRAGVDLPPGMCALHYCDNPPCVNRAHLFVGTRKQNNEDCCRKGRHNKDGLGEKHWCAKFSDAEVEDWKTRHAAGESFKSIARSTGAHPTTVSRTVRGIQRKMKGVEAA